MPVRIVFAVDLFNGPDRADSRLALRHLLECLYKIDVDYLRSHPNAPSIYQSGVRYMEEPPGQEDFQDIPTCLQMKIADCEDLACWRAAELFVRFGENARPDFIETRRPNGAFLYHVVVKRADGSTEDPSRLLGMR